MTTSTREALTKDLPPALSSEQDGPAPFGSAHGPHLLGTYAPVDDEAVWDRLVVEGQIPADLNGVYLRNGPNARFEPQGAYHPFDGDGMVHAAHFEGGRVVVRNRYVRTAGLLEEEGAGHSTHFGIMQTLKGRSDRRLKDTANTDVIVHRGRALATWYMAGAPLELDALNLDTLGVAPSAAHRAGFQISAHPKLDPHTGELCFFDYDVTPPYMRVGTIGTDGRVSHEVDLDLPGPRLPHDMAITRHHYIVHDLPLFHDHDAFLAGRHKLQFHSELPTRFGVVPRSGTGPVRWFEFSPCFLYHTVNAWEDGDDVVMVACRYLPVVGVDGRIDEAKTAKAIGLLHMNARLWCWRMNLVTGQTREGPLNDELNVEFPSLDATRLTTPTKHAYLVDHHPSQLRWTGLRKMNTESGRVEGSFSDGAETTWYSEPWFAARTLPDGVDDSATHNSRAEDDGYVVVFAWRGDVQRQELQVFDAKNLSDGPVARVVLPRRVPVGFHACWADKRELVAHGTWRSP